MLHTDFHNRLFSFVNKSHVDNFEAWYLFHGETRRTLFSCKNVARYTAISYTIVLHTSIFHIFYRQLSEFLEGHKLPGTNSRIRLCLTSHFGAQPLHYDGLKLFL